jgi:hypothetical protein
MSEAKYRLELNDGFLKVFDNPQELKKWADHEWNAWNNFLVQIEQGEGKILQGNIWGVQRQQVTLVSELQAAIQNSSNVQQAINNLAEQKFIASQSSRGVYITDLVKSSPLQAYGAMFTWNHQILQNAQIFHSLFQGNAAFAKIWQGIIAGANNVTFFEKGLSPELEVEKKEISNRQNELDELLRKLQVVIDEASTSLIDKSKLLDSCKKEFEEKSNEKIRIWSGNYAQMDADIKREYEQTKNFFRQTLALSAPVTYWSKRSYSSKWGFWIFTFLFLGAISASIFFGYKPLKNILISNDLEGLPENIRFWVSCVIIGFPVFCMVWILRLISKTLLSYQNQANDASLRATMTNTYLALLSEEKADEKDRILILNALFHIPSHSNEDGSPPHWFELLQARYGKT